MSGIWEHLNNPHLKPIEFDGFRKQAGIMSGSALMIFFVGIRGFLFFNLVNLVIPSQPILMDSCLRSTVRRPVENDKGPHAGQKVS